MEAGPELIFHLLCFFGRQLSTILLSVDIGPQLLSLNLGIEAAHGCGVPFDSRVDELQRAASSRLVITGSRAWDNFGSETFGRKGHAVRLLSFLEPRENSQKPIYSKL